MPRNAFGAPTSYRGKTVSWTFDGRVQKFDQGGVWTEYTYNRNGIRTSKNFLNMVRYDYALDGNRILSQKWGNNTMLFYYDENGAPQSVSYNGTLYTYVLNLQGDVIQIRDVSGNLVAQYLYNAWGKVLKITDANGNAITSGIGYENPLRYRGYYYDFETGFYYVSSRYYDPEIGRWINSDSQLNTSLGLLGLNLFSYCLNNPVNMADSGGNRPGDLFDTMDEAARDFAEYINAKSIEENREYASYIYSKTTTVLTFSHYKTHRFLFFTWKTAVYTKSTKTQYSYREPKRGTVDSSSPPINWFWRDNKVARLHTHAAYDPKYDNDNFSDYYDVNGKRRGDKINAINAGMPSYVATPLGTLRKFDPSDDSDIVLFWDIPFDPNHPEKVGKNEK